MEIIFGIVRWVVIIALLGVVLFRIFRIIRPFETGLVERLGKYNRESKVWSKHCHTWLRENNHCGYERASD